MNMPKIEEDYTSYMRIKLYWFSIMYLYIEKSEKSKIFKAFFESSW